jgi:hypothetical protein
MTRLAPVSGLLVLAACAAVQNQPSLTVRDVAGDIHRFDGRVVTIRGWLDECKQLSCGLFQTREEATAHQYGNHMLSIGSTKSFDRQALDRGPAEVILRARVDAACRDPEVVCMDRASELVPVSVRFLEKQ